MLGGKGYYRGSSILVSGTAGTGKTLLAAHFADAACRRGERCLYFAFEESQGQAVRNAGSIGLDLQHWIDRGLLRFHATRPTYHGLEMHLAGMLKLIRVDQPHVVVVDPISNLVTGGTALQAQAMLLRLVDALKLGQTTALFTSLTSGGNASLEQSEIGISSLIDTWILLRDIELGGERNRGIYVLKSRGMGHSNQIREFLITDRGIMLQDVYVGREGVLTGSMRVAQEARERLAALARQQEETRKRRDFERTAAALEAQIAALRAELEGLREETGTHADEVLQENVQRTSDNASMAHSRQTDNEAEIPIEKPANGGRVHAERL
jgi:circadian clock protein KaiC